MRLGPVETGSGSPSPGTASPAALFFAPGASAAVGDTGATAPCEAELELEVPTKVVFEQDDRLMEEDALLVPAERPQKRECCGCQRKPRVRWSNTDGTAWQGEAAATTTCQQQEDVCDAVLPPSRCSGDPVDGALWLLSCIAGSVEDEVTAIDGMTTVEVGFPGPPPGREPDLSREELFTHREVAMAAHTWTRASHLNDGATEASGGFWSHMILPGDLIEAPPGMNFVDDGIDIYRGGDTGTVSRVYHEDSTREECAEVTWSRTGRKSGESCPRERFKFLRRQNLALGDLLEALPGRECILGGVEHFKAGDEGTVSRFRKGADGEELVEVTCQRTGKVGTVVLSTWMEAFRFVRRQALEVGDTIVALPGVELEDDGVQLYGVGDEGVVTCFYFEESTGEDRMEVMWIRTGRKSDESARWMRWFRLLLRTSIADGASPPSASRWPNRFVGNGSGGGAGGGIAGAAAGPPHPASGVGPFEEGVLDPSSTSVPSEHHTSKNSSTRIML